MADVFLVIGSSLITQPAGNLPRIAKENGAILIIINRGNTRLDHIVNLRFKESASKVLVAIVNEITDNNGKDSEQK